MNNIKSFSQIFESSIRIPKLNTKGKKYWENKGKKGNTVMIYTHDDMDGIFSAIVVRDRLQQLGYKIKGYGVLNYTEAWKNTSLDPSVINVAVDFANMPEKDRTNLIDIYIDHHGEYTEEEKEYYRGSPVVKTLTGSAYEGICLVLGKPTDEIVLYSIDMIDSAKYTDYNVDWRDILDFNWDKFIEISKRPGKVTIKPFKKSKDVTLGWPIIAKLTFAGAFNQFLKRSDHRTVIEVIHNTKDPSIYAIYNSMKKLYPGNNVWMSGYNAGKEKNFIDDGKWRIDTMQKRTKGESEKKIFNSQEEFIEHNNVGGSLHPKGYQLIGNLAFIPSGTWANALRARAILLKEYDKGVIPEDHKINFIMLQYGNTIQVCGFNKLEDTENLPVLKNGKTLNDLSQYMGDLLKSFQEHIGYYDPDTSIGQEELTVSGGHVGIGTISNIIGKVDVNKSKVVTPFMEKFNGINYLTLFKNKMINDLSGIKWSMSLPWTEENEESTDASLIRDIINNDKDIKKRISEYTIGVDPMDKRKADREIRTEIRTELERLSKEELKELHSKALLNHKVMSIDKVRTIDNKGKISEMFNNLKGFNEM